MRRRLAIAAAALVAVIVGVLWYLDEQHRFDVDTETFTFESGPNELAATLAMPTGEGPHGVVAFVHGDGAIDATHDDGYLPIWEALADAGFASVSWDKPGVGDSTGEWLDQSMDDRADEVRDAIEALRDHPDLDVTHLGVIGFSQAGWVIPLLPERLDELDFAIAGSPAIDWSEQGRYLTNTALRRRGADDELVRRVQAADAEGDGVLADGSYDDHVAWVAGLDDDVAEYFGEMSQARWGFARRHLDLDAATTLPSLAHLPTLLLLAGTDDNVDTADTETTYRLILPAERLDVITYPDANHSLLDHDGFGLAMTAIFRPRSIFADGFLDDVRSFAELHRGDG